MSTNIFLKAESSSPNEMIEMFHTCSVQHHSHRVHTAAEHLSVVSETRKWNLRFYEILI